MQQETLRVRKRDVSGTRPARRMRREGLVPAVVYGRDLETTSLTVGSRDLYAVLHTEAGLNALIELEVDEGQTVLTVAREIQRDAIRGDLTHVDFIKVSLDVEIEAEVLLDFVGTPIGVREDEGFVEYLPPALGRVEKEFAGYLPVALDLISAALRDPMTRSNIQQ